MLKPAISYKEKLYTCFQNIAFDDKYKFYNPFCWNYEVEIENNSFNKLQLVSVDNNGEVMGYLCADIYRQGNMVSAVSVINFNDNNIFSMDLYRFLTELFTKYNFRKIEWSVFVGNPAEKMYDKIIKKYGGKITGTKTKTIMLQDGIMSDEKGYEIFKTDYDSYMEISQNNF